MKATIYFNEATNDWELEGDLDKSKEYEVEITEKEPKLISWDKVSWELFDKYTDTLSVAGDDVMRETPFAMALREARMIERNHIREILYEYHPELRGRQIMLTLRESPNSSPMYPADCVKS